MPTLPRIPVVLTVAGSDSGGGAGLQADLKAFASIGVHGATAVTCITAQNPAGVSRVWPASASILRAQIDVVFSELAPAAVKTGMLFSSGLIQAVVEWWKSDRGRPPLVVDPVMVATSGSRLLRPSARRVLEKQLLPLATVVTPNLAEAGILVERPLGTVEDICWAAREIYRRFGCAALVKGGHLAGSEAVDVLFDGHGETTFRAPFVRGVQTHGTGCTYSAALAAYLALGDPLPTAARKAKQFVTQAIRSSVRVGRHTALGSGARRPGISRVRRMNRG